ncbi:hypothetical protein V1517DRAFT_310063 [Lipomyces orientalis]|uniref:Uncharacterized protein n=1 Tax=Lipomyces orientalis TaxID=1233043 RepID=A0ACC3TJ73_9ASCO
MEDSSYSDSSEIIPDSQPPSCHTDHHDIGGHDLRHARAPTESPKKQESKSLKDRIAALKQARSQPRGNDDEDLLATMFAPPPGSSQVRAAADWKGGAKRGLGEERVSGRLGTAGNTVPLTREGRHGELAIDLPSRKQRRPRRMIYEDDEESPPADISQMPHPPRIEAPMVPQTMGMLYRSPLVPDSGDEREEGERGLHLERMQSSIRNDYNDSGHPTVVPNLVVDTRESSEAQESFAGAEVSSANLMRSRPPSSSSESCEISTSRTVNTRWQVRWNGRPNYKKFRKSVLGARTNDENAVQRAESGNTYVSFVEYRPEDFGIGDGMTFLGLAVLCIMSNWLDYWSAPRDASRIKPKSQNDQNILRDRNVDATEDSLRFSMSAPQDIGPDDQSSVTASGGSGNRQVARQVLRNLGGSDEDESDNVVENDGDAMILNRLGGGKKQQGSLARVINDDIAFDGASDNSDSDDDGLKFRFSK